MFRPMRLYEGGRVSKVKLRKPRDDRATPSLPITIFHWRTVRTLGCPRCSLPRRVFFREIDFRKKILYYRYHRRIIIHNCIVFIFYSFFVFVFFFFFLAFFSHSSWLAMNYLPSLMGPLSWSIIETSVKTKYRAKKTRERETENWGEISWIVRPIEFLRNKHDLTVYRVRNDTPDQFHSRWLRTLSRIDFPPRNMIYTTTGPKYNIWMVIMMIIMMTVHKR